MNSKLKIFSLGFFITMGFMVSFLYAHTYALTPQDVTSGTYNFKDAGTITATISGQTIEFIDSKPYDSNHNYKLSGTSSGICSGDITVNDSSIFSQSSRTGSVSSTIKAGIGDSAAAFGCSGNNQVSATVFVGNIQNAGSGARLSGLTFVSQVEIKSDSGLDFKRTDPKSLTLLRSGETGVGFQIGTADKPVACNDILLLDSATGPGLMVELDVGDRGVKVSKLLSSGNNLAMGFANKLLRANADYRGCSVQRINGQGGDGFDGNAVDEVALASTGRMNIADPADASGKKASQLTAAEAAQNSGPGAENSDSCVATDSGPLGWIICPIIDLASTFSQGVFTNFIKPFLEDVPVSLNEKDGAYTAWKQFRLIGNIVLVGTMLAIVYAQIRD